MVKKLDHPQEKILDYIKSYYEQNTYPPSVREICTAVGLNSPSTVHNHLKNLESKGLIYRDPQKQRSITLGECDNFPSNAIPLVGHVAAGVPILAVENVEDAFPLPTLLLHGGTKDEVFMLRVEGDSMKNAAINDGDIIVVNSAISYDNGDIVVAIVNGEAATVKRLYREKDHVRLQPENELYDPILVCYGEVEIAGKVVGLLRSIP